MPSTKSKPAANAADSSKLTPAMRQYVEQKRRVGEALLLFRMGDFYETFYEDAVTCARVLGIALTARNKGSENEIPLAGIPFHALPNYLKKLVDAGFKVAISEQLEDPKVAKGVVKRDVVRIVTSGTLTDEALLEEGGDNLLACLCRRGAEVGLAVVELASGRFEVIETSPESALDELVRCRPAELLLDEEADAGARNIAEQLQQICGTATTLRPSHELAEYQAEQTLLRQFGVATLAGFGFDAFSLSLCAAGCLIQYLNETQKTALEHVSSVRRRVSSDYLQIDHSSWRSLEIDRTLRSGAQEGSLLLAINRTVHPIGGRKLRHWLARPLTSSQDIIARQDSISFFLGEADLLESVRKQLREVGDVERIAGRVALARATPRDFAALSRSLDALPGLTQAIRSSRVGLLDEIVADLSGLEELAALLGSAVVSDAPATARDGGYIAAGFDDELDRLRAIGTNGQSWLAAFQQREAESTGIDSLKVGFHRVFGYYLEISNARKADVPAHYVRKQTVKNAERYVTEELKHHETQVLDASDKAVAREADLLERLRRDVAQEMDKLMRLADALGRMDCLSSLAHLARSERYVRPEFTDDIRLDIRDGRHPVLDQHLGERFVPNDTEMSGRDAMMFVITGPNMAGKSTYIRQVALLTMMAQIGSFVPARSMQASITDRIFARVGASDEIMRGQSTFMVEMTEAANVLHNATSSSLVVLDEIGRGTSTFDGLALAWAIAEHLANKTKCRALLATHYHELMELSGILKGVRNYNVAVRESQRRGGEPGIVFLHRIEEGGASQSYGIHVAELAGLPAGTIKRSREVLAELQRNFERESRAPQLSQERTKEAEQLSLFADEGQDLLDALRGCDPDHMTPLDALKQLHEWKSKFL